MKGDFPCLALDSWCGSSATDRPKGPTLHEWTLRFFSCTSATSPRVGTAMFDAFVALALQRRGAVFLSPVLAGLSLEAPKALGGFRHGRACPTQSRRRRAPVFYVRLTRRTVWRGDRVIPIRSGVFWRWPRFTMEAPKPIGSTHRACCVSWLPT